MSETFFEEVKTFMRTVTRVEPNVSNRSMNLGTKESTKQNEN